MKPDFAKLRTTALASCELPRKFADWPRREQEELLRLAELSSAEARAELANVARSQPGTAGVPEHTYGKVAAFLAAVRRVLER